MKRKSLKQTNHLILLIVLFAMFFVDQAHGQEKFDVIESLPSSREKSFTKLVSEKIDPFKQVRRRTVQERKPQPNEAEQEYMSLKSIILDEIPITGFSTMIVSKAQLERQRKERVNIKEKRVEEPFVLMGDIICRRGLSLPQIKDYQTLVVFCSDIVIKSKQEEAKNDLSFVQFYINDPYKRMRQQIIGKPVFIKEFRWHEKRDSVAYQTHGQDIIGAENEDEAMGRARDGKMRVDIRKQSRAKAN